MANQKPKSKTFTARKPSLENAMHEARHQANDWVSTNRSKITDVSIGHPVGDGRDGE